MPFEPLPGKFLDLIAHLQTLNGPAIVDLGSGDGAFGRLFSQASLQIVELDRSPLAKAVSHPVRANAIRAPFRPGSLDCLVAGNLMRHLMVQDSGGDFLLQWINLLKPGGTLFLFEDEPDNTAADTRNFVNLQSFLAELMPGERGPLVGLGFFLEWAEKQIPAQIWQSGVENNLNKPSVEAVEHLLTANGTTPNPSGAAGRLLESIKSHGLSYGSYWWASAQVNDRGQA